MTHLTPEAGEHWRFRPRDGEARAIVEHISQFMWKWRIEVALIYIMIAITLAGLFWIGVI